MDFTQNGKVVGDFGLAMKNVGLCDLCGESKALMYAVWEPGPNDVDKPVLAVCCQDCLHIGGIFQGIAIAYALRKYCRCDCHKKGVKMLHVMPCCKLTGVKYIDKDGKIDTVKLYKMLVEKQNDKRSNKPAGYRRRRNSA